MVRENTVETYSFERPASPIASRGDFAAANLPRAPVGEDENNQSIEDVQRYRRARGGLKQPQKDRGNIGALALLGGVGQKITNQASNTLVFDHLDDNTRQGLDLLRTGARYAQSTLQMLGPAGLGIFAAEAALTAADVRGDARTARQRLSGNTNRAPTQAAGEAFEEGAERAARAGAGLADEATEASVRSLSRGLRATFRAAAKRVPFVGAAATGYFAFREIQHFNETGQTHLARAAGVVGAAETVGNLMTFGLAGDVFREAARGIFTWLGGSDYEQLQTSDVRYLAETGADIIREEFGSAARGPQTVATPAFTPTNLNFG